METRNRADSSRLLRQVLTELVDAVLNSDRAADCNLELVDLINRKNDSIKRERRIADDVALALDSYMKEENIDLFKTYRDSILDFTRATLQAFEEKLIPLLDRDIDSKQQEMNSYRGKSVKAIEAFLSREPLPLLEWEIRLRYVDGGYEVRYICTSQKDLQYEFLLNSSEVEFLRTKLEAETLVKGIRLPARMGKTWVSKDPVIDFEKLDHYFLSAATLSSTNLVIYFASDEVNSSYMFHSSVSEDSSFLEIEYKDQMQTVNITSQPAMNSALNRDALTSLLSQIRVALLYLRDHKLRLSKLTLRDIDIISTMKVPDFFLTVLEILAPVISQEIALILNPSEVSVDQDQSIVTRDFLIQRLSLLGGRAETVSSLIGVPGLLDSFSGKS